MPIVQQLSSKANVKKLTNNDLPFAPQQPVISSYYATSVVGQTVINLSFSVDTTNPDAFFLFIDGKKLMYGSANDYTFTSLASDKTSSQVTLSQSIASGLNIQAFKMGLKKESEFQTDNRFVQLYEAQGQAFQAFINTANVLTATSSSGTPAAGTFYSSIQNRAPLVDLTQDLRAAMGIDRVMVQQIIQLQNEFGPNGEPVWATPNDLFGQIRFVGNMLTYIDSYGPRVDISSSGTPGYAEVTFYGTGLNVVVPLSESSARSATYSVDGGTATTMPTGTSNVIGNRQLSANIIIPAVSGLALGVHTVKITASSAANGFNISGFEILNESSQVKVNPGVSYIQGKKIVTSSQNASAYNSGFESGVLGSNGGRVLVYQKSDGTIAKAVRPVNAAPAYLSSADHTNEEMVRQYNWREFGAGRSDDFSGNFAANSNLAFTLDDGTTTLVGSGVSFVTANNTNSLDWSANGSFITFTFVGTGCDYIRSDTASGGSDTFTLSVDGAAAQTLSTTGTGKKFVQKLVSGLPYGTHTVRITRTSAPANYDPAISAFIVYQPKKPSLPSGAVELADYNVMGAFSANSTVSIDTISSGTLRKALPVREAVYADGTGGTTSWTNNIAVGGTPTGWETITDRSGAYVQYTFFGTGFDLRFAANTNRSANISVTVDGLALTTANFPSLSTSTYGGTASFSAGTLSQTGAAQVNGCGFVASGLPLGLHTVRFTNNTASSYLVVDAIDIITPIHSVKSNLYADLQNTLPVGSCAISDNRKFSAIKDVLPAQKAWAQAIGIQTQSITSTAYIPMADMSLTVKSTGGPLHVIWIGNIQMNTAGSYINVAIFVDGVQVTGNVMAQGATSSPNIPLSAQVILPVSAGTHKVDVYWRVPGGQSCSVIQDSNSSRTLSVREI